MAQTEPGTIVFNQTLDNGFHGLIIVGPLGALCGYVGIQGEHPLFEKEYSDCSLPSANPRGTKPEDSEPISEGGPVFPKSWQERQAKRLVCGDRLWCNHSPEHILECHGGITYSGRGAYGMREDLWYFGFDCSHSGDVIPGMPSGYNSPDDRYRESPYVQRNVESLAKQLAEYTLVVPTGGPQ
jgi:hypothetical protein